jgi:hypothetical protein
MFDQFSRMVLFLLGFSEIAKSFVFPNQRTRFSPHSARSELLILGKAAIEDFDPRVSPHLQSSNARKIGIIVVDHGSRKDSANNQLLEIVRQYKAQTARPIVEPAHMELAPPSLKEAFAACVKQGATSIVCHPFFLSPGRHVTEDIPTLMAEAASAFPDTPYTITLPLGASPMITSLIEDAVADAVKFTGPTGDATGDMGFFGEILKQLQSIED